MIGKIAMKTKKGDLFLGASDQAFILSFTDENSLYLHLLFIYFIIYLQMASQYQLSDFSCMIFPIYFS